MAKLKVLELFAGIGACSKALTNLGIEHEIVDAVEIDKYAIKSFNTIHGTDFEPQDITEWSKDIECDLLLGGFPCQDISVAGKQAGIVKDKTRSGLMYEMMRIIEKLKPKYVIAENVKNILSKKHKPQLDEYITFLESLGYEVKYQVLDASKYGIPQHRERCFVVGILGGGDFEFPEPIPLEKKLKDMLEDNVDEKYYLSDDKALQLKIKEKDISNTVRTGGRGSLDRHQWDMVKVVDNLDIKDHDQIKRVYGKDGVSPTITTMEGGNRQPKNIDDIYANREPREYSEACPTLRSERSGLKVAEPFCVASRGRGENNEQHLEPRMDGVTNTLTSVQKDNYVAIRTANKQGYDLAKDGDGIDLAYPESKTRRGRVGHGVAKTLECGSTMGTLDGYRIRKLTEVECWKLMGFEKSDCEKARASGISKTQLYKQAGNSIVVNVLEAILKNLL